MIGAKKARQNIQGIAVLISTLSLLTLTACGKSNSGAANSAPSNPGTPSNGCLSNPDTCHDMGSAPSVIADTTLSTMSARYLNACAVNNGAAACVGPNTWNLDGLESGVSAVSVGLEAACAIKNGAVYCWGVNSFGELGSAVASSDTPVPVAGLSSGVTAIAVGELQACAVQNGGVVCWGDDVVGGLGDGGAAGYSTTPVQVIGLSTGVQTITAGAAHICALLTDGEVKCWGAGGNGQNGNASFTQQNSPITVSGLPSGAVQSISAGQYHTCAVINGAAYCWGFNGNNELGNTSVGDSAVPVPVTGLASGVQAIAAGDSSSCAVQNGSVLCWGATPLNNSSSPTPVPTLSSGVTAMTVGSGIACAVQNGVELCWGSESFGATPAAAF